MNQSEGHLYRLGMSYIATAKEIALTDAVGADLFFQLTPELVHALADTPFDHIEAFVSEHLPRSEPTVPLRADLQPRDYWILITQYYAGDNVLAQFSRSRPDVSRPDENLVSHKRKGSRKRKHLQPPALVARGVRRRTLKLVYRLNREYFRTLRSVITIDIEHVRTLFSLTPDESRMVRDTPPGDLAHFARLALPLFRLVLRPPGDPVRRDFLQQLKTLTHRTEHDHG